MDELNFSDADVDGALQETAAKAGLGGETRLSFLRKAARAATNRPGSAGASAPHPATNGSVAR